MQIFGGIVIGLAIGIYLTYCGTQHTRKLDAELLVTYKEHIVVLTKGIRNIEKDFQNRIEGTTALLISLESIISKTNLLSNYVRLLCQHNFVNLSKKENEIVN